MSNITGGSTGIIVERCRFLEGIEFVTICQEIEQEQSLQHTKMQRTKNNALKVVQVRVTLILTCTLCCKTLPALGKCR